MDEQNQQIEPGDAGAPEGAVAEPSTDDVAKMYDDLGIKASVPSDKSKKRPKTDKVRTKDDSKKESGNSDAGKRGNKDDASKSKDAPTSSDDGDSGDDSDEKGKKVSKDSGKVSEESKETDSPVRDAKSRDGEDSESGSEKDSEQGDKGTGQKADESGDEKEEGQEDEGKRPGKSNPEIEKRFQQLTAEKRERDEMIERLQKQLKEKEQAVEQSKVAQEDPEYTVEDFRKVKDDEGNVIDLDPERAELAWRRWKDGYDQRQEERQAESNRRAAEEERESEMNRQVMEESVKAYDTLATLMDEYPELVSTSDKYDEDFAGEAMPIIQESIQYLEGTEPGNPDGNKPVITGLKINPQKILSALKGIGSKKRSLPLNGVNDNVEPRSNVGVPHSRSSDPNVNAANDLYKELGIKKRI